MLHEMGQPLHAFDADKLVGKKIIVKKYPDGTKFTTLDEKVRALSIHDTMISDAKNPVCIGGVLGGLDSGVTESTKNIFLECAYFDPVSVRKTARRHTINTDSSFRYERGVDPRNIIYTLKRTALLIKELTGGSISSEIVDIYPEKIEPCTVEVQYSNIDRLIGKKIPHREIKSILESLEIKIVKENDDIMLLEIPTYRVDVTREADVIEEILRIYGYNNIEIGSKLNSAVPRTVPVDKERLINSIGSYLVSNGFYEIMSNSITKSGYYSGLKTWIPENLVKLHNPLSSDLDVMRQTLLFSGLEAIAYNMNRQRYDLRLFEFGNVYSLKPGNPESDPLSVYHEEPHFGIFLTGNKYPPNWAVTEQKSSFHQLKAYYGNILSKLGINENNLTVVSTEKYPDIYSGGLVYSDQKGRVILTAGIVNEDICKAFDIETEVFYADLYWEALENMSGDNKITYKELPKFPEVRRDLALLLDNSVTYNEIVKQIKSVGSNVLKSINLFDYYKGKGIPEGKKSYGISFYLQDMNKTLTDAEIDRIMKKFQETLVSKFHAELR
jgi:phenylalanyl-tRNA synthetase beta chain